MRTYIFYILLTLAWAYVGYKKGTNQGFSDGYITGYNVGKKNTVDNIIASNPAPKETPVDTGITKHIKFLKNSAEIPIHDSLIIKNDTVFNKAAVACRHIIGTLFTHKQVKKIKEIVLCDAKYFADQTVGMTHTNSDGTYTIVLAMKARDVGESLLHEIMHVIFDENTELFKRKYYKEWSQEKLFLSNYAHAGIDEDVAETGAISLMYAIEDSQYGKIDIIRRFIEETR